MINETDKEIKEQNQCKERRKMMHSDFYIGSSQP